MHISVYANLARVRDVLSRFQHEVEEFQRDETAKKSDCLTALYLREIEEHKNESSFFHSMILSLCCDKSVY